MLVLALLLAAGGSGSDQILAGRSFEIFAQRTERSCPARSLRTVTPGDLDWLEETFEERLADRPRRRLAATNDAPRRCADRNGLSCSATATLDAMARAHLLRSFVDFACAHQPPS